MKRRSFLKGTMATGVLVASGVPLLASCSGVKRSDLPVSEESAKGLDDESARILWYASLAPSGHNSQPWFVKVLGKGEWIVGAEPRRRLPAVDPDNRELLLSIGAFAENLSLAASAAGYESAIEVIAKSPRDEEVLRVSLKKTTSGTYPLERLTLRRTVKNGFLSKEIRNEDVKVLSEPHAGRLFYYPRGTDHARCIQEGTVESYRAQTYRDDAQKELANWIRFSNAEARKHRDGLTTEGMDLTGFSGWFVIETGRRFERTALLARERNLALHPMTQVLEEEKGRREIASNHGKEVFPQFVLRVGYLDHYPTPVSLRRTVASFVRTERS